MRSANTEDPHILALALFDVVKGMGELRGWTATDPHIIYRRIEETGINMVHEIPNVIEELKTDPYVGDHEHRIPVFPPQEWDGLKPSEICSKFHVQNCHDCDFLECHDNLRT
jgi:hypothetical protein